MVQLQGWLPNSIPPSTNELPPQYGGATFKQLSRGAILIGAVVGSTLFGMASAKKTTGNNLASHHWRRAGGPPESITKVPTQSAFPNTLSSFEISPTDYFKDSDSGGFRLDIVEKSSQAPVNWVSLNFEKVHFLGAYGMPGDAQGVHVIGNLAYVAVDTFGLQIINVTTPTTPSFLGSYDTAGNARRVQVVGNYAYIADGPSGLSIIDVSDPNTPTLAGSYDTPGDAQEVHVVGNFAYIADDTFGLSIINVNNPNSPTLAGSYDTPGNANGVDVVGNLAYVTDGYSGLSIIDVSNPSSPALAGTYDTSVNALVGDVIGNHAYVATGSRIVDIIDVSNPSTPTLTGSYATLDFARGLHTVGNLVYVAENTLGVEIIDVSNPNAPNLAGSFNSVGGAYDVDVIGTFIYICGLSSGLQVFTESRQITASPTPADIGNYEFELIAEDPDLNRASSTFTLRVEGPPAAANTITNQLINVDSPFNFFIDQAVFPDPNNDIVYYAAKRTDQTALPPWLSFSPIGIFSGTPQSSDTGTYDIRVEAYDGKVLTRVNSTFSLTVDHFPTVLNPITNQAANIDALYSLSVPTETFSDLDIGDTLSYNSTLGNGGSLPAWLNFNPVNLQFSGTPTAGDAGSISVSLSATDTPGASALTTFTLTVGEFPTLLIPIPDQLAATGTPYHFSIPGNTFTPPPGEVLTYSATKADGSLLPAWLGFVGPRLEFQGTAQPSDRGLVSLKVVAEDSKGGTAQSLFDLNVADALSQEAARIGGSFVYAIPDDMISSPLGPVTNTVTLGDGSPLPAWLSYGSTTHIISGIPPIGSEGIYSLSITADDGVQPPVLGTLTLNIGPNSAPKIANPLSSQTAQVGQKYRLVIPDNTFTDANGDTLDLSSQRVNGRALPSWLSFTDRTLSGKPSPDDTGAFSDKTVPLQICATDGDQETCSNFDLSVQGTSNAETIVAVLAPLAAAGGLIFGWYKKRGLFLNPWNREKYDKGTVSVPIDARFSYTFEAPKSEIALVKAFQGERMFGGLPAPKSLDKKGWLEWVKCNQPITGGKLLPSWLTYNEGDNQLVSSQGPKQKHVGLYTVRAYGQGEVILEEIKFDVGGQGDKKVEMYEM